MFGTKDVQTKATVGKYLSPGNQFFAIRGWDIKTAASGNKQIILHVETQPIESPDFKPEEGFQGQVGKIALPWNYLVLSNEKAVAEFNRSIGCIADALGVREQLDKISGKDFEEYVNAVMNLFKDKFAWWAVSGEEYTRVNGAKPGKIGTKLSLRRWHYTTPFVSSELDGPGPLGEWDKSKSWNFKPLTSTPDQAKDEKGTATQESEIITAAGGKSDLPF